MSFDKYAKNWDTERRISRSKTISSEIGKTLKRKKYDTIMEFGCGTGLITFNLLDRFEKATLVDASKEMIEIVNKKAKEHDVGNIEGLHMDLTTDEISNRKFDAIYSSLVLHHIDDIDKILGQFYKLLNEGGEIAIVDLDEEDGKFHKKYPEFDGHNGFNHNELESKLQKIGYKEIEIRTFYHGEKIIEDEKVDYSLFIVRAVK